MSRRGRQGTYALKPTSWLQAILTAFFMVIKTPKEIRILTTRGRFLNGSEIPCTFLWVLTIRVICSRNSICSVSWPIFKERGFHLSFYSLWSCLLYNKLGMNFVRIIFLKKSKGEDSVQQAKAKCFTSQDGELQEDRDCAQSHKLTNKFKWLKHQIPWRGEGVFLV